LIYNALFSTKYPTNFLLAVLKRRMGLIIKAKY
jgi:hypothetical protein